MSNLRYIFRFSLAFVALLLLLPENALAQINVGSSGSLVGAALETAGFYYQSYLLDVFTPTFQGSMGILVYMIGTLTAIGSYVMMGDSKMAKWFLFSPALFFSVIIPRTETLGTAWVFGAEERATEKAQNQGAASVKEDRGSEVNSYIPRVSSVFAWYDNLISDSVRGIVAAINGNDRLKSDVNFLARTELLSQLKSEINIHKGFRQFLQISMLGHCRRAMESGRQWRIVQPPAIVGGVDVTWDPLWTKNPPRDDCVLCDVPSSSGSECVPNPPEAIETRECILKKRYRDALLEEIEIPKPDGVEFLAMLYYHYPMVFDDVIQDPGDIRNILGEMKAEDAARAAAPHPATYSQIMQTSRNYIEENLKTLDCVQVWNTVYVGLHMYAMKIADRNIAQMRERNPDLTDPEKDAIRDEALEGWMKIHGAEPQDPGNWASLDPNLPVNFYRVIAQTIFRNEMNSPTTSAFIAEFTERTREFSSIEVPGENDVAFLERTRLSTGEWEERSKLMHTAGSLPYYQGLALYFLTVSFPFFALLLLIPSKYGGFILWFGLWMWIKSWDIGFAVVMLIDDALFSMMAARAYHNPPATGQFNPLAEGEMNSLQREMSTAIYVMNEADPTYSLTTYYAIIAIALQSIPVISSYLVMGSLRGGGGMIASGMKNYASYFGGVANLTAGQSLTNSARAGVLSGQMGAARGALANAKAGRSPYAGTNLKRAPDRGVSGGSAPNGGTGARSGRFMGMSLDNMQKWAERSSAAGGFMRGWNNGGALGELGNLVDSASSTIARRRQSAANKRFIAENNQRSQQGLPRRPNSQRPKIGKPTQTRGWRMTEVVDDGNGGTMKKLTRAGKAAKAAKGLNIVTSALEDPLLSIGNGLGSIREAEVNTAVRWAKYDYTNSAHAQYLSAVSRIAGGLEIPMTEDGAYDEELKKQITIMKAQANLISSGVKALDKTIGAVGEMRQFGEDMLGDLAPDGALDAAGNKIK